MTAALCALIHFRKRIDRTYLWGAGNFIIPLLPALGFFSFGSFNQSYVGDHLAYYAIAGFAFISALCALIWARSENRAVRCLAITGFGLYVLFLGVKTYGQTRVWSDNVSLWAYTARYNPGSLTPHVNLASALLEEKRLDEAEAAIQKAHKIDPEAGVVYNNMAMIQNKKGNKKQAIKLYKTAVQKTPNMVTARLNLGRALEGTGAVSDALNQYKIALQIRPYNATARFYLADALVKANRMDEAIAAYEKALSLRENTAKAHNTLGVLYLVKKKYDKGIEHLQRATQLDPGLTEARENLRHALRERKRNAVQGIPRPAEGTP